MAQLTLHFVNDAAKFADRGVTNDTIFDLSANKTIALLVRVNDLSTDQALLEKRDAGNSALGWSIFFDSATVKFGIYYDFSGGAAVLELSPTVMVNTWYLLIFTYTLNASIVGYMDSVSQGNVNPGVGTIIPGTNSLTFGKQIAGANPAIPAQADIRSVAFWSRVLNASEISAMGMGTYPHGPYHVGTSLLTNLVAYWPLSGDLLDWSDGLGAGTYPLTGHGGLGYTNATPEVLGLPGGGIGSGSPVVAATPSTGSSIAAAQALQFDVTDTVDLGLNVIYATFPLEPGRPWEVVYGGAVTAGVGGLGPMYADASTVASISGGLRFTIRRTGGWTSKPKIVTRICDSTGAQAA